MSRRTPPSTAPDEAAAICRPVIEELAYTYEAGYTGAQMREAVRQTLLTAVQPLLSALDEERRRGEETQYELDCAVDARERLAGQLHDLTHVVTEPGCKACEDRERWEPDNG